MPFHCNADPCNSFAFHCFAPSCLAFSTPLLYIAFRCCAIALLRAIYCISMPSQLDFSQYDSLPSLVNTTPCIHSRCCTAHIGSMQFHCSSEPCFATPLHVSSNQRIAVAAQVASSPGIALAFLSQSSLCRCRSTPSAAQPYPAIAIN